jgi:hypothetical protein
MSLQTEFVADPHLADGQVLGDEPRLKKGNFLTFEVGKRKLSVLSKEGQHLEGL